MNKTQEQIRDDLEARIDAENMADEAIEYQTADARCNFCDGDMPCYCEPPKEMDYEADAEARNRVDLPWEDWPER